MSHLFPRRLRPRRAISRTHMRRLLLEQPEHRRLLATIPIAVDDAAGVGENGPAITMDVLADDTRSDGALDPLAVITVDSTSTFGK